jgi:uncharacterized radical SAM superfamily protein
LEALTAAGLAVVPHVVVGLDYGRVNGEYKALDIIKSFAPAAVVVVALMPLPGTPMATASPPAAAEVAGVLAAARLTMPDVPLTLGCARPRGDAATDVWAVKCGVNGLAIPADEAVTTARALGLEVLWEDTCCSVTAWQSAAAASRVENDR